MFYSILLISSDLLLKWHVWLIISFMLLLIHRYGTCTEIASRTTNKIILVNKGRDLPKHTGLTKFIH